MAHEKAEDTFVEVAEDFTLDPQRVLGIQFICEKDEQGNKPMGDDVEGIVVVHMVGGTTMGIEGATRVTYRAICEALNKATTIEKSDDRIIGFAQDVSGDGRKISFSRRAAGDFKKDSREAGSSGKNSLAV